MKGVLEFLDVKGVNSGISDTCSREKGLEFLIHVVVKRVWNIWM